MSSDIFFVFFSKCLVMPFGTWH